MEATRQSSTDLILDLGHVSTEDRGRVGAKAANLGSLLRAGFPIPAGVVLTIDAHSRFAAEDTDQHLGLRHLIEDAVSRLGDGPFAVRSSGVAEDLPDASFAGQYETVLGAEGLDELEEAVRRCWASGSSAHISSYRDDIGHDDAPMAVLIQVMVDATSAGVAFSANPVSGNRGEVVINAVRGLGDRLVSGAVSPDEWVVSAGESRCESPPEQAIDDSQARAVAELARRVEEHFGSPQDIEWAIEGDPIRLLQARPITSLPDQPIEPIPIEGDVPPGFWFFDASHASDSYVPIDAFLIDLVKPVSQGWCEDFGLLFDGIEFRMIRGWPYQRMVPLGDREGPTLPAWLMKLLVRTVPMLRRRVSTARDTIRSDKPGRYVDRWSEEWQGEMDESIARLRDEDLEELSDEGLLRHLDAAYDLMRRGLQIHGSLHFAMSPILYELVKTCEELLGWDAGKAMDLVSGTSYKSTEPARRLKELADMSKSKSDVLRLLEHRDDKTIDRLSAADDEFAKAFSAYLHEYGCRATGHTTLGAPTLAEQPELLLGMVAGQIESGYDPEADYDANARRRAETLAEAEAILADQPYAVSRLRRVVERGGKAYPVREDNEFFCFSSPLALLRYTALEMGRRLAERGVIDSSGDVLYLEIGEVKNALARGGDYRQLVLRRKGEWAWAKQHPGPPHYGEPPDGPPSFDFLPAEARTLMESQIWNNEVIMAFGESSRSLDASDSTLTGIAASRGEYTGTVRVVMGEREFDKIKPGDVVVCPITSPVWSVVFPMIGALVTDTGGVLSHPAIIAREYRVPAVVATAQATSTLQDGDLVTVDGTTGTVRLPSP
jgi:pyruvate,water dikinase